MSSSPLGLFDAYGIEMEYMLVDQETLNVRPMADQVLAAMAGHTTCDVEIGPVSWSNELALHVIELKTTDPAKRLRPLPSIFEKAIGDLKVVLDQFQLQLLPTAVHPWMDPTSETQLWPHQYSEIYQTYDQIFNCHSHGWSNVQSVHLNLPFSGDQEFGRLHAAVRILLPLLPAMAASSPVLDGRYSGLLDTRMKLYADHCSRVPCMTGDLVPEAIFDEASYRQQIFEQIARDVAPLDPKGVMKVDFMNARGAIARFDRGSIELRVMDVQEYPGADVAICAAVAAVLRALCDERWSTLEQQKLVPTAVLAELLEQTSVHAEGCVIENGELLRHFGIDKPKITAKKLWATLLEQLRRTDLSLNNLFAPLEVILETGTLATRIKRGLGPEFSRTRLVDVYREVADCLVQWEPFQP